MDILLWTTAIFNITAFLLGAALTEVSNNRSNIVSQKRKQTFFHSPPQPYRRRGKRAGARRRHMNDVQCVSFRRPFPQRSTRGSNNNNLINIPFTNSQHSQDMNTTTNLKLTCINARSCRNKTNYINDLIEENSIDILCITETWLHEFGDEAIMSSLCPPHYIIKSFPRRNRRGGGIAFIFRDHLSLTSTKFLDTKTCETASILFQLQSRSLSVVCFYRPPSKSSPTEFLNEFHEIISDLVMKRSPFIITGDFNFDFNSSSSPVNKIKDILEDHELQQHVKTATHESNHILDWIVSPINDNIIKNVNVVDKNLSDHLVIFVDLDFYKTSNEKDTINYRNIKKINMPLFKSQLKNALINITDADDLNSTLKSLIDQHAPKESKTITKRFHAKWFNEDIKSAKVQKRRAERRWRKTGLEIHKQIYLTSRIKMNDTIERAKCDFYSSKLENVKTSREFFNVCNEILGQRNETSRSDNDNSKRCNEFSTFFKEKIKMIRQKLDNAPSLPPQFDLFHGESLCSFAPVTEDEVRKVIGDSAPKSCDLDPLPINIMKECLDDVLPCITNIINVSLHSGVVPACFKIAYVKPLLKKCGLDENELKNFRPVSNLPFLSKILEKIVLRRLINHINLNNLFEIYQSAYKSHHSTETAILKVYSDILNKIDDKEVCLLTLLDLSAAFDTIDHEILINRLNITFGISGTALSWFDSYLKDRKQSVQICDTFSDQISLEYGVPQGSVLGPILFTMYTQPLSTILKKHDMDYHLYADDLQMYKSIEYKNMSTLIASTESCCVDVGSWMDSNKLKLNNDKTEAMLCGNTRGNCPLPMIDLGVNGHSLQSVTKLKNLGVVLDSDMSMKSHINHLCKVLFFQIKKLSTVRKYLTIDTTKKLVCSYILSRIDYCNSIFIGITSDKIDKLQRVQNNAAKLILKRKKSDSSTHILKELHWLPIRERIHYKIATLCFKCLHDEAPLYLKESICINTPSRTLRSSSDNLLFMPKKKYKKYGERSFEYAGPVSWNCLPKEIRQADNLTIFKKRLKHFLFLKAYT